MCALSTFHLRSPSASARFCPLSPAGRCCRRPHSVDARLVPAPLSSGTKRKSAVNEWPLFCWQKRESYRKQKYIIYPAIRCVLSLRCSFHPRTRYDYIKISLTHKNKEEKSKSQSDEREREHGLARHEPTTRTGPGSTSGNVESEKIMSILDVFTKRYIK